MLPRKISCGSDELMLTELFVKNIAIIDEVRLSFGPGMTVLTGETGAGKSILVESIGLVIGGKASPQMIRSGEKEGVIEAVFSFEGKGLAKGLLKEWGFGDEDQLIVRRHLQSEGKNKIYLNGRASSLGQLSTLGPHLIDLVSQNDQQILLNEATHLSLLDEGDDGRELASYREHFKTFEQVRADWEVLKRAGENREERAEFLRFQLAEIDRGWKSGALRNRDSVRARISWSESERSSGSVTARVSWLPVSE